MLPTEALEFLCINANGDFGELNEPTPIIRNWRAVAGNYNLINKHIPEGTIPGEYECFIIMVLPGDDPLEASNWIFSYTMTINIE